MDETMQKIMDEKPVKESQDDLAPKQKPGMDEKYKKYKDFLVEGENIRKAYNVGFLFFNLYVLLFTNKRLIIIKRIPRNVIELYYKDIELVEFYTNIEWLKMFYSILIYVLIYQLFLNLPVLMEKVVEFIPPLEPLLYAGNFFGLTLGAFLPLAALFIAGTYYFGLFVMSVIGRLRILIYDQPPIDIATLYNSKVTSLIHTFSELSENYRGKREKQNTSD